MKKLIFIATSVSELLSCICFQPTNDVQCPQDCPMDYSPICAYEAKAKSYSNFSNECQMDRHNQCYGTGFKVHKVGECSEEERCFDCQEFEPVCAYNFRTGSYETFDSYCAMELENVCPSENNTRYSYSFKCDGSCRCSIICPADVYEPVCGKNTLNNCTRTFQTRCSLDAENACNPTESNYEVKYEGACKCPIMCPKHYTPVCARDRLTGENRTFGNECEVTAENLCPNGEELEETEEHRYELIREGACEGTSISKCPKICTEESSNPVCICDSEKNSCKTFGNQCEWENENECNGGNYYTMKNDGDCLQEESAAYDNEAPPDNANNDEISPDNTINNEAPSDNTDDNATQ